MSRNKVIIVNNGIETEFDIPKNFTSVDIWEGSNRALEIEVKRRFKPTYRVTKKVVEEVEFKL